MPKYGPPLSQTQARIVGPDRIGSMTRSQAVMTTAPTHASRTRAAAPGRVPIARLSTHQVGDDVARIDHHEPRQGYQQRHVAQLHAQVVGVVVGPVYEAGGHSDLLVRPRDDRGEAEEDEREPATERVPGMAEAEQSHDRSQDPQAAGQDGQPNQPVE